MMRAALLAVLVMGLASCGSSNSDGSVATGPLGQTPLMTQEVKAATRIGINACIDAVREGKSLSSLQSQGFAPWRGGYRMKIDNPLIFAGNSSVAVALGRGDCRVTTGPAYPIEMQTAMTLTREVSQARGFRRGAQYRKVGDKIEIILR